MKILIVDSDQRFAAALSRELSAYGHEAECRAPADALDALRAAGGQYALAVVEYADGGREFLREYRDVDFLLPVIIATYLPSWETAAEFLAGGAMAAAIAYIQKPHLDIAATIVAVIEKHFTRIEAGDFVIERTTGIAAYRGEPLPLKPVEYRLLLIFAQRPYVDIPYPDIELALHGKRMETREAFLTVKPSVHRLRRVLREVTGRRDVLRRFKEGTLRFTP